MRKSIILATAFAVATGTSAFAQDVQVRQPSDNVTKVDVKAGDARGNGMTNPAQTKARAQVPGEGKVQVKFKNDPTSQVANTQDLDLNVRRMNDNVTKVDGTVGDFRVKGISTPGTTNVKVQDPGQIKVQVQAKPKN